MIDSRKNIKLNDAAINTRLSSFYQLGELSLDVLYWEADENLNLRYTNHVFQSLTGLNEEHLRDRPIASVLKPKDTITWNDIIGEPSAFKALGMEMNTKEGQAVRLNVSAAALIEGNELIGYYGTCTIRRKNKNAKTLIKQLQNTSQTILRSISEALIIIDKNQRFLVVSHAFSQLWSISKEEMYEQSRNHVFSKIQSLVADQQDIDIAQDFSKNLDNFRKTKDTFKLKNGAIIERKSFPHLSDGTVIGRCWTFKDISQQVNLIDQLGKLAFRDSLTKLYNRRWCEKKLIQLLKYAKANKVAFMYLDLDHFKVINDSCGHINGDEVLEQISQLLLDTIGKDAFLSRLGGDEFGLILTEKSHNKVLDIAERIKKAIANYSYHWKRKLFKIGISIGIVFVNEEDDFKSVFVHADEACYISKETGRNKCTVYDANQAAFQQTKTDLKWYDAIQKALLNGQFELWCQSIHDPIHHQPYYEILLRMRTEKDKLISPAHFMNSADRFGMIVSIDKRVISDFCLFCDKNKLQVQDKMFSINVSGHSLSRDGFLNFVLNCLENHQINCHNICFEITESELIKNFDHALIFIKRMRLLGCKIALDDFGKGLTSFSYLKNIPYDYIKIDGQFIKELNQDKINKAVIKSIVYIAEVMEKKTIAEHIESEHLYEEIKSLGVDYFQGNHFSEPHQITKLLK